MGVAYASSLLALLLLDVIRSGLSVGSVRPVAARLDWPSLPPTVVFYLLYGAGLVFFAVAPGLAVMRWAVAVGQGAVFGLAASGAIALTSRTLLRGWTGSVDLADIAWGTASSAMTALGAYWLAASVAP